MYMPWIMLNGMLLIGIFIVGFDEDKPLRGLTWMTSVTRSQSLVRLQDNP